MRIFSKIKGFFKSEDTIYDRIVKNCLYALVFLIPIFFLPLTHEYLEIAKTVLLYFLVTIASLVHLLKIITKKKITRLKSKLNILVLIFLIIYLISSIFSYNWRLSLFGLAGYYNDSLITILILLGFLYLIIQNFSKSREILKIITLLLASSVLVIFYSILQLFKVDIFSIWQSTDSPFSLIANSISILSIWLGLTIPICLALILYYKETIWRSMLISLGLISFTLLFLIDSHMGWFVLVIGLFIFLIFISWHSRKLPTWWVIIPTVLIIVSILMIFVSVNVLSEIGISRDIVLGQNNSWQVIGETLKTRFLTGSGPNTVSTVLDTNRPVSFNSHPYWGLSFVKTSSQWSQLLLTTGPFSLLIILALAWFFVRHGFKKMISRKINQEWIIDIIIFTTWLTLFLAGFFYTYNLVLSFLFWLFLGLGLVRFGAIIRNEESLDKNHSKGLLFSAFFGVGLVVAAVVLVFTVRFYLAEQHIKQADSAIENLNDIEAVENNFIRAAELNPLMADYRFSLAESYLVEAGLKVQQGNNNINNLLLSAATSINKGVDLEESSARALIRKAGIYRDFRQYILDTADIVFSNFKEAQSASPNNPLFYFQSGQSYLVYAQDLISVEGDSQLINQYLEQAETDLEKSLELKNDLLESYWLLAQLYDLQKSSAPAESHDVYRQKAIDQLEIILLYDPNNQAVLEYYSQLNNETS